MRTLLIGLSLMAAPAVAQEPEEHPIQTMYRDAPCTEVVGLLDAWPDLPPAESLNFYLEKGMAWGFLLGFDAMHPEAKGEADTLLSRVRLDCAAAPETPALTILEGYLP